MSTNDKRWDGYPGSRRQFLKAAGATGTIGLTGLAGCAGDDPDEDDVADDDTTEVDDDAVVDDPAGDPVTMVYEGCAPDLPLRNWYGEAQVNNLEEIGFEVEYHARAAPAYVEAIFVERNHDATPLRWLDGFDPDRALSDSASSEQLGEGGGNVSGHDDDWYQEQLHAQRAATDQDERQAIVHEMQEHLVEEGVFTPLFVQDRAMPYNSDVVSNTVEFLEDGLSSVWNLINVEVDNDDNIIRAAYHEETSSLNPVTGLVMRSNRDALRLVYDRLMMVDPDNEYLPSPWAAESVDIPDDTTYEITLRDGMEFHDGEPVTAEDVRFSYEYCIEHNDALAGLTGPLEEIEVIDDLQLTMHLSEPSAPFEIRVLAGRNAPILPQHHWEGEDPGGEGEQPSDVGSGPFQLDTWERGEEIRLSAHDGHHHEPNVDGYIRVETADGSGSASMLLGQEVDMIPYDMPPDQIISLEQEDFIEVQSSLMTSIHYTAWNMRREPFSIREARRAGHHTLNRHDVVDIAADGLGQVIRGTFSPDLDFWYNADVPEYPFDLDEARNKLADAGFQWDAGTGQLHYPP